MRELRFTHPDLPDYVVEITDGTDAAAVVASLADEGWTADIPEDAPAAEVPVGETLNLNPETPADQAAPAEPDTTDQPAG